MIYKDCFFYVSMKVRGQIRQKQLATSSNAGEAKKQEVVEKPP